MMRRAPLKRTPWPRRPRAAPNHYQQDRETRLMERAARATGPIIKPTAVLVPIAGHAEPCEKENPLRSERYRRLVAAMPCINCGAIGWSQHAHTNEGKGKSLKTDDRTGFPLCCTRPGIEGCHVAFDQYRLIAGGSEAHHALARKWGAATRAQIEAAGTWPRRLPKFQPADETTQ